MPMNREPSPISRRSWLLGTLGSLALGPNLARGDAAIEAIKAQARSAGMEPFDESESANYRGIGDASKRFREEALEICEAVAADYRKHFSDKGFDLDVPKDKLTVVILMGPKSYAAFERQVLGDSIGGHFDLKENRLVMFDFRGPGANPKAPVPELDNTLALVHETIHQLTYNTGVLELKADVPLCVIEGLATYGETWRPKHKGEIGAINVRRRAGLELGRREGVKWIPIETLLAEDKLLDEEKTMQVAYAESWMFVYKMLRDQAWRPKFRGYLKALREKPDPARRMALAKAHFGDLTKLDREIRTGR
jgi:Protein of unknown function (DUF1570)